MILTRLPTELFTFLTPVGERAFIEDELADDASDGTTAVVITHHPPTPPPGAGPNAARACSARAGGDVQDSW